MTHPNNMAAWDEIHCRREHETHVSRTVHVAVGGPTRYSDYTDIPMKFAREFDLLVWDPAHHPVDGGPYCPAHDAVSETIVSHKVWEPRETTLALAAFTASVPDSLFIDFGSQIGWFTLLAAACGLNVDAYDADSDNVDLLTQSAIMNGWETQIVCDQLRVDENTGLLDVNYSNQRVTLVKIDIEGSERDAIRILEPALKDHRIDHLLIEISPVFADYYPDLVVKLVKLGYTAYQLPPKARPATQLVALPQDLERWRLDTLPEKALRATVAGWHQEDVWFALPGAAW